jgi:[acyl-carrier-protein] S-malonyltransferase
MTESVSLPLVFAQMRDAGTSLGIVLGPSIPAGVLSYPFPVVHIATPADVTAALSTAYEFGIV